MYPHRKPYSNCPRGGIPTPLQHIARRYREGTMDVTKGGHWYFKVRGFNIMCRKFPPPTGWKFILFYDGEEQARNLDFEQVVDIIDYRAKLDECFGTE